eukprot:m.482403 g.482403  ORF g.482403 m.482403 type:complete len:431 (-) comp22531_c0_seq1:419-1711(-)
MTASTVAMVALPAAVLAAALLLSPISALDNGVGRTPPMGWLSWERYTCQVNCDDYPDNCVSERLYMKMADLLVSEGYADAGYTYINVDDCWQFKDRGPDGELRADPFRFPHGMKALGEYIHSKGLKFGIYSDIGPLTCGGYPAFNVTDDRKNTQWEKDLELMMSWKIDSLKVDGCYAVPATMNYTYPLLGKAMNASKNPILYSCSWPDYVRLAHEPVQYNSLRRHCNTWRNYNDITDSFDSLASIIDFWAQNNSNLSRATEPGAFNDPDMLMIGGTGLSEAQEQIQMAMWAIFAGPLLMSNDLTSVLPESKAILLNHEVIAINQDPLGKAGSLVWRDEFKYVWKRDLFGGNWFKSYAVALVRVDLFGGPELMTFTCHNLGFPCQFKFQVRDLFKHEDLGNFTNSFQALVTTSSVNFYKVTVNIKPDDAAN